MPGNSLTVAANALNTYQEGINVISNNLANAGSTGFKEQTLTYTDQVYQQIFSPSAPTASNGGTDPIDVGLGVKISSRHTNYTQGGLETTGNAADMAINGDGFFILSNLNNTVQPTYTRNGAFTVNQNGILIEPGTGLAVQGYTAAQDGTLPDAGSSPGTISIPIGLTTTATGTGFGAKVGPTTADNVFDVLEGGNLDSTAWQTEAAGVSGGAAGKGTPQNVTTTVYDSLGTAHQLKLTYTPDATGANSAVTPPVSGLPASVFSAGGVASTPATRWKVTATFTDGTLIDSSFNHLTSTSGAPVVTAGATSASADLGYAFFDSNGQFINSSSVRNPAANSFTDVHKAGDIPKDTSGDLLNVTSWAFGNNSTAPTNSAQPGAIGVSYSRLSSLAGAGEPVTTVSQNGFGQGTLTTFSVGNSGVITGAFSNGQQKALGQVVLATFENLQGLATIGSGQYVQTPASGLPQLGVANTGRFGNIVGNTLEQSNISIASEFTKLIITQNAYISNSKSISVANQLLQTINNLIA